MAKKNDRKKDIEELEGEADIAQETITMTQVVTVPKSAVTLDSRTMADPKLLEKEEKKQAALAEKRKTNRVAKLKAKPKTPAQVRKELLESRFRRVKSGKVHGYRKEQLIAWAKEYEILKNRPDSWSPGCVRAKKAKTAQDFIDELQIDD